ncbi:MAG: NAD(+) synthase [Pseudomonadota bacterium]
MATSAEFTSLYTHGFARVGVATPLVHTADPAANAAAAIELMAQADAAGVAVLLFPELNLSAYAIDDLLLQDALLDGVEQAIADVAAASVGTQAITLVGAPLRWQGRLLNCAVVVHRGRVLGAMPKTYLPNYREFYEARHFDRATTVPPGTVTQIAGQDVPLGTDLLFQATDLKPLCIGVEICEDVWVPVPPSSKAAMAGATVIANLSASNAVIGKSDYRHALCRVQSGQCMAAYMYSAAGLGESTTDLAWDGHAMIYENGALMAESARFADEPQLTVTDVDLDRLVSERQRHGSFTDCAEDYLSGSGGDYRRVGFILDPKCDDLGLIRPINRFPFVPNDRAGRDALCAEAFEIQSQGLAHRLRTSGVKRLVIGVSGGLDSSQALLVACHAFDRLGYPRTDILAYTLPAYATSDATKSAAWDLMRSLGVAAEEIDLTPACDQMLRDIGHPAAGGKPVYDIAFENVQAGARTSLLFRLANQHKAMVLGTGDLSELALGWCTYGVGDQMSHYNVNASVPKTLIQHLIGWVAETELHGDAASTVLRTILNTEISPELIPGDAADGPSQKTEDTVGPYALQDFNIYYITRYGMKPSKVAFMSWHAWRDAGARDWPSAVTDRTEYDLDTIRHWLRSFLWRFFQSSQFKRSAMPNGPKISSGGSLSPRGDWRAPSDAKADVWVAELDAMLPPPQSAG